MPTSREADPSASGSFTEITEHLVPGDGEAEASVMPHMIMPPGSWALCTYESDVAGVEPRTEVVRPGQIVPQTLLGGRFEFVRGVLFRLT